MDIRLDDLRSEQVIQLVGQHLEGMAELSPPESIHALGVDALRGPAITFWTAWNGDELLGCGALKALGGGQGEIKSMRTASAYRRQGVAARLLQHIIDEAHRRAYTRLSLETGSMAGFAPARALYQRFGFAPCGPFADYVPDPNSAFMTLHLVAR